MCDYKFEDGTQCKEKPLPGSKHCILHIPFPEDRDSEEFKHIAKLKEEKVKEKVENGDFNFEGAILLSVDFSGMEINSDVNFNNAVILGDLKFIEAEIGGDALFNGSKIKKYAWFNGAKIKRDVLFYEAEIGGNALFDKTKIERDVWFGSTKIGGFALFDEIEIGDNASFNGSTIEGHAWFEGTKIGRGALFEEAEIGGNAQFSTLDVQEKISLKNAIFKRSEAEENACRAARRSYEKFGDRKTADTYFLREMRARRRQKGKIAQFLEWMIADFTCRYGTDSIRPVAIWLILVLFVFPCIYYFGHGIAVSQPFFSLFPHAEKSFASAEYFSVVTATTLGYGDLQPVLTTLWHIPIFRVLASLEAIFGTFMWVIFLTVFARKYMR